MNALVRQINETRVEPGGLHIWWIGQEGFVLKSSRQIIYIDPYLSTYAEKKTAGKPNEHVRIRPAPMDPEDVTHADIVFCTHDHADHIDPEGIPSSPARRPAPASSCPNAREGLCEASESATTAFAR